jgi:hypothetical protein
MHVRSWSIYVCLVCTDMYEVEYFTETGIILFRPGCLVSFSTLLSLLYDVSAI